MVGDEVTCFRDRCERAFDYPKEGYCNENFEPATCLVLLHISIQFFHTNSVTVSGLVECDVWQEFCLPLMRRTK